MKNNLKPFLSILAILIIFSSCKKTDYKLGALTAPSNLVITTEVVGQDATNPDGDGSGDVKISVIADDAVSYKVDYDATTGVDLQFLAKGTTTKKYTTLGTHTYTITAVAYGAGGTSTTATKDVTVKSNFIPDPTIVTDVTNDASKSWVVDKSVAGHFGVGPWDATSSTPAWWAAAVNEKVACCNCFYTATFTFTKVTDAHYTLQVNSVDGAFTKTGSLTTLPGIPGSGDEGCYSYGGGTTDFSFVPPSSGIDPAASTGVAMLLAGNSTYIGYGALQKEYEILDINPTYMYLRVQGTETGNAWYLKLKPL